MEAQPVISFDNTEIAFAYKSDKELKQANFLFSVMGKPWLVKMGTKLTPPAVKWNLPFVKPIDPQYHLPAVCWRRNIGTKC